MKKNIALALVLLILLTACQTVPDGDNDPVTSTPSSNSVAPNSSISSSSETHQTETEQRGIEGLLLIFKGSNPYLNIDPDLSLCTTDYLYWIDKETQKVYPVCEEPIAEAVKSSTHVYYIKTAEPTKIYMTPISDFTKHEMIYECSHGVVSAMIIDTSIIFKQLIMQFVADNKKFVVLDLETGEDTVLMEQHYIRLAMFADNGTDTWEEQNIIYFDGQPTPDDRDWDYLYYRDTGKVLLENDFFE